MNKNSVKALSDVEEKEKDDSNNHTPNPKIPNPSLRTRRSKKRGGCNGSSLPPLPPIPPGPHPPTPPVPIAGVRG